MFSAYLYKKLISVKHFLHNSTSIRNTQLAQLNCYSNSTSFVNVDDLTKTVRRRKKSSEEKSYIVSHLMNSYGVSREKALVVSATIRFKSLEKPNSALSILRCYGFSDTQIDAVVRKFPSIVVTKENTILPKLEFFLSTGMSKPLLVTFISRNPKLLQRSLDNSIVPTYNFLKSLLLTDERVINAMKQNARMISGCQKRLLPNIHVLRELKVPESRITYLVVHFPETLVITSKEFEDSVSKVLEMGFDPLKTTFVLALHAVSENVNKVTWDHCYETYSNWGWSKEDIYLAFRKHPNCMLMSRNKIDRAMDFLVNKIGVNVKVMAHTPTVMFFSLEKRIIPRFSVIQVLLSKGLIKSFMLSTVLMPSEKYFLDKFVVPYEGEIPKLYDCYKGKVGVEDL